MGSSMSIEDHARISWNTHFMVVDGISTVMTQRGGGCRSSEFEFFGLKWCVDISSNIEKGNCLSCSLVITDSKCIGSKWEVQCFFELSIGSPTGDKSFKITFNDMCFDENHMSRGKDSFISYEDLKKYIVDEKVVFSADIILVKQKFLNVNSFRRFTKGTAERIKLMEVPGSNSRFTWKITQFSSFDAERHSSYEFTFGPRRWFLQMYPKGSADEKGKSLSLFLHASDNGPKEEATPVAFKLRVLDQLKRNHHEKIACGQFSSNSHRGYRNFLSLEELHKASNGFLVNDEIYLGVEFLCFYTRENP